MKQILALATFWKKVDIIYQCVLFLAMLVVIFTTSVGLFGLYLMAIGQFLSALTWFFVLRDDTPRLKTANVTRIAVIITVAVLSILLIIDGELFFAASIFMLLLGPILGFGYFFVTIFEYRFYAKVRKPYYLL